MARGNPSVEDTNAAIMYPANKETDEAHLEKIERRLIQEVQEQRTTVNVTQVSTIQRAELFLTEAHH